MSGTGRLHVACGLAFAALACLAVLAMLPSADAASEHLGISLPFNYSPGNTAAAGKPSTTWSVSNIGATPADVDVYNSSGLVTTLTVPAMSTSLFVYVHPPASGDASVPSGTIHTPLYIHWFRSASDAIVVSQFAAIRGTSAVAEGTTLIPTDALGYHHYIPEYSDDGTGLVAVVAGADGATVTMTPTATIADGRVCLTFSCSPPASYISSMPAGAPFTFTLAPYESRRMDGWGDLAGSVVESDRPVAVFVSSFCAKVAASSCNHLEEQVLPDPAVGPEYVGCAHSSGFNSYRVVATRPGVTDVTIDPTPIWPSPYRASGKPGYAATGAGFTVTPGGVQLAGPGAWYQFDVNTNVHINATKAVAVSAVTGEKTSTPVGDPSLLVYRPVSSWAPQYDFWVPDHDWVSRTILVAGPAGSVGTLDGVPFSLSSPAGASTYACQLVSVTAGQHRVVSGSNLFVSVMVESSNENRMWYAASASFPPLPEADFVPTPELPPRDAFGRAYYPAGWAADVACAGQARRFDDLSTPGTGSLAKSEWDWGDATPTTAYDPWATPAWHTYATPGTYTVELHVWNSVGGEDYTTKAVKVIDCHVAPVASFRVSGGGADCLDNKVHFYADDSYDPDGGPVTFEWDFGDGTPKATGNPATHQFASVTSVTVTLTVRDDDGRSSTATMPYPAPGDPNCPPDLATLKDLVTTPGQTLSFPLSAVDADGPKLDIRVVTGKPDGTLTTTPGVTTASGTYSFGTQGWDSGTYTLTFEAFDGIDYDRESMRVQIRGLDSDVDRDGVQDAADNCPGTPNVDQVDTDQDGLGDACEDLVVAAVDDTPTVRTGAGARDTDRDGIQDVADNCVLDPNADQADMDADGEGDACDADQDGDTVADKGPAGYLDNCPTVPNADQRDSDGQGGGDACAGLAATPPTKLAARPASALDWSTGGGASAWGWLLAALAVLGLAWAFRWRRRLVPALLMQFSRLSGRDALDHPVRAQLAALVYALPGVHQRELARRAGRSRRVVTYHLGVLLGHGILQSSEVQGYTCYYPKGYPRAQLAESRVLRAPLAQQILEQVQQHPGQDATTMARHLGVSNKGLHYHIRRMEKAGILRGERRGLVKQLYPAAPSA